MNKPIQDHDLDQAIEAQARGEKPEDTPSQSTTARTGGAKRLDQRRTKMPFGGLEGKPSG